jgi:hypothetical protein
MTDPMPPLPPPSGPSEAIIALRLRLGNAAAALSAIQEEREGNDLEVARLAGKIEGVHLALSYLHEETRMDAAVVAAIQNDIEVTEMTLRQAASTIEVWDQMRPGAREAAKALFRDRGQMTAQADPAVLLVDWEREIAEERSESLVSLVLKGHAWLIASPDAGAGDES